MKKLQFIGAVIFLLLFVGCMSYEEAKQLADSGNAEMQLKVAEMLLEGDGVIKDTQEAEKYLIKAMEQKNLEATCMLISHIIKEKKEDNSLLLQKAYNCVWSIPYSGDFYDFKIRYNYPKYIYDYISYLKKSGYKKSAIELENKLLAYKRDEYLKNHKLASYYKNLINSKREQEKIQEAARIAKIKRQEEIKKQEEAARLAKIKRQEEIKKQAEAALLQEKNWILNEKDITKQKINKHIEDINRQLKNKRSYNISYQEKIKSDLNYLPQLKSAAEKEYNELLEKRKKAIDIEKKKLEGWIRYWISHNMSPSISINMSPSISIQGKEELKDSKAKLIAFDFVKKAREKELQELQELQKLKNPYAPHIHTPQRLYKNTYSGFSKYYAQFCEQIKKDDNVNFVFNKNYKFHYLEKRFFPRSESTLEELEEKIKYKNINNYDDLCIIFKDYNNKTNIILLSDYIENKKIDDLKEKLNEIKKGIVFTSVKIKLPLIPLQNIIDKYYKEFKNLKLTEIGKIIPDDEIITSKLETFIGDDGNILYRSIETIRKEYRPAKIDNKYTYKIPYGKINKQSKHNSSTNIEIENDDIIIKIDINVERKYSSWQQYGLTGIETYTHVPKSYIITISDKKLLKYYDTIHKEFESDKMKQIIRNLESARNQKNINKTLNF